MNSSANPSIEWTVHWSIHQSIHRLSIHPSFCASVCASVCVHAHPCVCIHAFMRVCVCPSVLPSVRIRACTCVHLSICLAFFCSSVVHQFSLLSICLLQCFSPVPSTLINVLYCLGELRIRLIVATIARRHCTGPWHSRPYLSLRRSTSRITSLRRSEVSRCLVASALWPMPYCLCLIAT